MLFYQTYFSLFWGLIGSFGPSLLGYDIFKFYSDTIKNNSNRKIDPEMLVSSTISKLNNDIILNNFYDTILHQNFYNKRFVNIRQVRALYYGCGMTIDNKINTSKNLYIICGTNDIHQKLVEKYPENSSNFVKNYEKSDFFKSIVDKNFIFQDIGRNWIKQTKLKKWKPTKLSNLTYGIQH